MRRTTMTLLTVLAMASITLVVVFADSANFDARRTSASCDGTDLNVNFRETGLGNTPLVNYTATANATAEYLCINGGDNHPKATNKETVSGPVSNNGSFPSSKNGSVIGTIPLSPPGPGSFTCPSGQTLTLGSVSYSNVKITDTDHNVSFTLPGTFSCP
jgi:hypothetical protein